MSRSTRSRSTSHSSSTRPLGRRTFLVVAGGGLLAACSSSRTAQPGGTAVVAAGEAAGEPTIDDSVVMVGDSLTEGSVAQLEGAMTQAEFTPLRIDGASARRIAVDQELGPTSGITAVADAVAADLQPEMWVVALGTNDVAKLSTVEEFTALITEMLRAMPADTGALVWVDVYLRDYPEQMAAFNEALRAVLGERPFSVVAEWSSRATEPGLISPDGVHFTADGNAAFADTVVEALDLLR